MKIFFSNVWVLVKSLHYKYNIEVLLSSIFIELKNINVMHCSWWIILFIWGELLVNLTLDKMIDLYFNYRYR